MFRSPRFKNEGHPDTWSHGNLAVLTANGRARITWVCSHIGLRPYPVGIMHFASASVMKGVLQSIINDVFNGAFVWRYLDLFMLVFVGQSSSTQWFTTACHVFSKLILEIVFIDCCVAHGDRIDNERMDMINAPQAPECHVVAELWLHLATCWGIQLDFACQPNRSR